MVDRGMGYAAPERTLRQRMDALERANEIRTERADWKRAVKRHVGDLLEPMEKARDPYASPFDTMKVMDYLVALPKVGRVKANKVLVQTRISPSKTLVGLTPRQRDELLAMIGPYVRRGSIRR